MLSCYCCCCRPCSWGGMEAPLLKRAASSGSASSSSSSLDAALLFLQLSQLHCNPCPHCSVVLDQSNVGGEGSTLGELVHSLKEEGSDISACYAFAVSLRCSVGGQGRREREKEWV